MAFHYVLVKKEEMMWNGKIDAHIQELFLTLPEHEVTVKVLSAGGELKDILSNELKGKEKEALVIAARDETLMEASQLGIATIGFLNPDIPGETYESAQILVEGFEEIDFYFLERIYNRKHNIPWRVIDTKRCYLREMTMDDLDDLYELYAGRNMTKYMEPLYEDRGEEEAYTKAYIDNQYFYYGYGMWLVMEKSSGKLIGRAGLNNQEIEGEIELEMGYAIAADKQRQGYAYEVCQGILKYAEEFLEFEAVNCLVEKENMASIQLLKKLGFYYLGDTKIEGKIMARYLKEI